MSLTSGVDVLHGLRLSGETPRITPMTSDDRVRSRTILTVGTGNLRRSPVVERLLPVRSR
jgi:hypothetical protein